MSERKSEDEYFTRIEKEQKAKLKAELDAKEAVAAAQALKDLHWNHCGKCGNKMKTLAFRGIEIEQCPSCGAVLLDPGELEDLAGKDGGAVFSSFFTMFGAGKKG